MDENLTILDLIKNNTLNSEIAGLLWEAVSEKTSFLTCALYQNAGKSTLSKALLSLRSKETPLHFVSENIEVTEKLLKVEKPGGYLVVSEFNSVQVPGYIWGEKIQHVFEISKKGYSLQACIHSESAEEAIVELTRENGISDEDASLIKIVLFIEMFGTSLATAKRRLSQVYEVHFVENGKPRGHTLYEWDKEKDLFVKTEESHLFAINKENISKKSQVLQNYVNLGKTTSEDLTKAIEEISI